MIRSRLTYHAPSTPQEASALLAEHADAVVLGGGTMLLPQLARDERTAAHVVDLRALGLDTIEAGDGAVTVGARVTYSQVIDSAVLRSRAPLLPIAAAGITGGAQIRNQGTIGGSACYANPASDVPACLVALGARMRVQGPGGERELAAGEFFTGPFASALAPGELLVAMVIPDVAGRVGYHKVKLAESSWPIATAAAVVGGDGDGTVTLGGVAATPLRIEIGAAWNDAVVDAAVRDRLVEPWEDELAPGSYRRDIAGAVARRALADVKTREQG